jgi:nucleoside-diphosphate-sugar epimerase
MMSSQILVTGGAGFIGSHLTNRLEEQGYRVRVLDNFSTGRRSNLAAISGDVELIEADIQDYEWVAKAAAGCEVVFHQAALASVPHSIADPLANNAVNVTGTLNVLLAARDHGARRVILASSSAVYGPTANGAPTREEHPTTPISPYATAKLALEGYARNMHIAHGLETVALRYFNVFGPRQDPNSQYAAAIPNLVTALLRGEPPVIFGDGEQSRDFVYVANVVHANLLAMRSPEAPGNVYNVACGHRITLNRLVRELCRLLATDVKPAYAAPRPGDIKHSSADIRRAQTELGYAPVVTLTEGLKHTIEHFRHSELTAPKTLAHA